MVARSILVALVALVALAATACVSPEYDTTTRHLEAACEATVIGVGTIDVETDYLPAVVNCENGAADFEALKAQAVTARSYLYYRLELSGDIEDGQSDQVYTCGREPGPDHVRAVEETAGQVLRYQGTQVAAFYVAGSLQDSPSCTGGTGDPTDTEKWVTYNEGLSGDGIEQTMLGFVDPSNHANRGCMSQNGSDCLAERGDDYQAMLRFYYGEDIEIETAIGPCVDGTPAPDAGPSNPADDVSDGCGCQSGGTPTGAAALLLALLLISRRRRRRRRL